MATASWSGTSTCTSMSGIESHAALCLATPYHDACYRSVNGGDHPGEAFQSGSVDHSSNVRRDRRPRQHRVRGGGVPCLSSGGRACRTSGGQRGWRGPEEPTVTPRWDGCTRDTSPLGSGTPGAVRMGWSGPRRTGAGPEVREELVDHRRLGHERDEAHRAVAGRTRERVDLKERRSGKTFAASLNTARAARTRPPATRRQRKYIRPPRLNRDDHTASPR